MPLIGLSANWNETSQRSDIPGGYVQAVVRAGGTPMVLPICGNEDTWRHMVDAVDGLVFTGGADIDPALFGEEKHPATSTPYPPRDAQELFIMRYAKEQGKPMLAICRGMQVMNCLEGGTLYQDIAQQLATTVDHAQFKRVADIIHQAHVEEGSLLATVCGSAPLNVNSRHHQAIKTLGKGLVASALSTDGLIEGIEYQDGSPCIALQWHPESLFEKDARALAVFEWLIRKASKTP